MLPLLALAAANATNRQIYHSSQTPGYTAWCALWSMGGGAKEVIMTNFVEAKGPSPTNATFSFPVLATTNNGADWVVPTTPAGPVGYSRGMAVMAGSRTMVRPALNFGSDAIQFGPAGCENHLNKDGSIGYCHTQYAHGDFTGVEISTDGGQKWGGATYLVSQQDYSYCVVTRIHPLRDGRVVAIMGLADRHLPEGGVHVQHHMAVGTFASGSNRTLSWGTPMPLVPLKYGECEESDMVELPNGTLFFMHRATSCPKTGPNCAVGENHIQSIAIRHPDGSFTPQLPTTTFPNEEFPCLVLTRKDNVLLHIQATGSRYSLDFGASWADLKYTGGAHDGSIFTTQYYPRAVEAADGTIVVTSHHGSDDAYMPRWPNGSLANQSYAYGTNEAIWAQTFRLLPLAPTSSSSPSAGGAAAIKTDDTEGTTIRLLATRHARPTRSASAASPVLCHGGFRFRFDRHRFKMISVKTDDEPTIGPPSAAVSLVHGEAVATTWPMEPLTTAYDPHGYHKGKTGFSLGNHRVEVVVSSEDADKPALVTRAEWRRRPTYARGTTSLGTPTVPGSGSSHFHHRLPRPETELAVSEIRVIGIVESSINGAAPAHTLCNLTILNETSDEALIVFQPEVGAATYTFYFMPYTYEGGDGAYRVAYSPRGGTKMDCPAPVSAIGSPTAWQTNNGTMKQSLASPQSPSAAAGRYYATNAVWKTVDGNFNFSTRTPADKCITPSGRDICEGFDGASGIEQLIYDFGDCVRLDGFALWAVGDGVHDPHGMSLAVANSSEAGAAWVTVHEFVGKANTSEKQVFDFSSSPNATRSSRFWRWTIADRCCVLPRYQAYVREVEFQASALGAIKAVGGFSNRAWLTQHRLSESPSGVAAATALPHVAVSNYTARTEWDRFHASEIRATAAETAAAVAPALAASEAAELFMSKRTEPIRMHDALPLFWTQTPRPARHLLTDTVHVHEYYVFQIGVYALQDLEITGFQVHGATNVTCFNLGGTNFHGSSFNQTQRVNASTIGALSFGLPVPATAASQLEITISLEFASQAKSQPLKLKLAVEQKPLIANGTADSWRMARMRWLDSNRGMSLQPSAQFSALVVNSETKSIAFSENRTVTLGANGLPAAITSRGRPILAGPVEFKLGAATFAPEGDVELTQLGAGLALWRASMLSSSTPNAGWRITVQGSCSYDGYIEFNVTVHCVADNDCESESGAELMVPIRSDAVRWFMGLSAASGSWPPRLQSSPTIRGGRQGTAWRTRSVGFAWQDYSRNKPRMQAWLGTPEAGIRIKLKGTEDAWNSPIELPDDAATMTNLAWASCAANGSTACTSWDTYNEVCCSGLINVTQDTPDNDIVFKATTGQPLRVAAGTSKPFVLDLLVTPNKPVSTHQHFTTRYYHFGGEFPWPGAMMEDAVDLVLAQNATWLNIHQGSNLNLYIDYPLRSDLPGGDRLAEMVEACHARGAHVKLYFTTRELTNRCSELFLVKALPNHEIIFGGAGGGGAWLQEHVNSDYTTAWSQPSPDRHNPGGPSLHGVSILGDEAVADSGYGRWNNFYVSAVNHLVVTEPKVDGLYLDGIAFDRTTLERVRKGMEAANKPVRIDIHMSNAGGCQSPGWRSPALGYMQHFSFADSLWFGEGFDYWGQDADWWLLETAGIPFGLTGDMIREGPVGPDGRENSAACPDPNRWLGAVFGMASRLTSLAVGNPTWTETVPVWREWLDFGIESATMVGWWADKPMLVTGHDQVKATVFIHGDSGLALIAVGNFQNVSVDATLSLADGRTVIDSSSSAGPVALVAKPVEGFQPAAQFALGAPITIAAKRGWMLRATLKQ